MNKLIITTAGVVVASGMAFLAHQHHAGAALVQEANDLRPQAEEAGRLRQENESLSSLVVDTNELAGLRRAHSELVRLRGQAPEFRRQQQALAAAQAELRYLQPASAAKDIPPVRLADGLRPDTTWNNVGSATPEATFETLIWAQNRRDTNILARSIVFDPEARARAEQLLAALPESTRGHYASAEDLISALVVQTTRMIGMRILSQDTLANGDVELHTQWQYDDGRIRENDLRFRRFDDGNWRSLVSLALVNKLGGMLP